MLVYGVNTKFFIEGSRFSVLKEYAKISALREYKKFLNFLVKLVEISAYRENKFFFDFFKVS